MFNFRLFLKTLFFKVLGGAMIFSLLACTQNNEGASTNDAHLVQTAFEEAKAKDITLRAFLQAMPKGGDLHNHLYGAIYAESWLEWAEQDGMCINTSALTIVYPADGQCLGGAAPASEALSQQLIRNEMIDRMSLRDFTPSDDWSGHDQFFASFDAMAALPSRFGDMLADAARSASANNTLYLELMHTAELFETILPMTAGTPLTGDPQRDYQLLMDGPFGAALPEMLERAQLDIQKGIARKSEILGCGGDTPEPACDVEIRLQNQTVRILPPASVFAHLIFGWHLIEADANFVGANLVAPEDDEAALKNYQIQMEQIGFLQTKLGPRNVALHAGELTLGLVHPEDLRFHIRAAIETAKARRIGHGIGIVYEDDYPSLLADMKERGVLVEVNLTSNDVILGVKGDAHPYFIYKDAGVPMALSTDDEGVSRIDLTHEYMKAVRDLGVGYDDLKAMSYNALIYAFIDKAIRAELLSDLDTRFAEFEAGFAR